MGRTEQERSERAGQAEQEFKTAVECQPESYQYRLSLAKFYDGQRRWPEAIRAYEEALARFPGITRALRYYADMYHRMGDEANSLRVYQRLLATENQPVNTVRAIDKDTNTDENYAYAHYAVGRADLNAYRQAHDPARLAAVQGHFLRCLASLPITPGGKRLDEMYKQLHMPRDNRLPELEALEAKAHLRLAELTFWRGRTEGEQVQQAEAAPLLLKYPGVRKQLAEEDAATGGRR